MTRFTAIALTVLTGFSGLVYEVTWQKYLATLLGSQGEATAAILAIFLGGLSAGYAVFGKATRRLVARARQRQQSPRLLLFYGMIEAGIGLYALCFPLFFGVAQKLSLLIPLDSAGLAFTCDVLLSTLLIGPPSVLMGGTIPILTLGLAGSRERATRIHALIYGCNTAGAFVGALAAAFVLIPRLGLHGVLFAMGALNIAAGFVFALLDCFGERVSPDLEYETPGAKHSIDRLGVYAAIALLTGFAMMALQTTFNRIGALSFGASHFTFAIIVSVFVFCIALGSLAVSFFRNISRSAIVITQWVLVAFLFALYSQVENAPYWAHTIRTVFQDIEQAFFPYYAASFACIFLILLIPIGLSGALLPLLFHHLRGEAEDLGSVAGRLYSWNAVGSLLGALFGGYVLLFWLDLHQIYRIALAALVLQATLLTALVFRSLKRKIVAAVLVFGLTGLLLLPQWSPVRLSAGLFRERAALENSFVGPDAHFSSENPDKIVAYNDGPTATVTVRDMAKGDQDPNLSLYVNGKSEGNLNYDYATTSLLALIPALMVEKLERCFVIGFGTGITVGELAALESVQEVDVAEISRAVITVAPLFDRGNLAASKNPKVTIRRGDAYRTLMRASGTYDVIVSEPSNPWVTGVEMLFSVEFLEAARSRLSNGGVYAQWMHLYELDTETIELVLRNYAAVFPHVSIWITQTFDILLIGFDEPESALDVAALEERFERPDFSAGLKRAGVKTFPALLARELVPLGVLHASELEGPLHTLAHPRLSDLAARAFFAGNDAKLPKLLTREAEEVGSQNSLLRRYAGYGNGALREEILEIAVRATCDLGLVEKCATLVAYWRRTNPKSERRSSMLSGGLRSGVGRANPLSDGTLATIGALFGGRPLKDLQGPSSLLRAKRVSALYANHYHHPVPFDRKVLRDVWGNCSAEGCREAKQQFEKQLGKINTSSADGRSPRTETSIP